MKGEQLCVSLLLDGSCSHWEIQQSRHRLLHHVSPDTASLLDAVTAFKSSLKISEDHLSTLQESNIILYVGILFADIASQFHSSVPSFTKDQIPSLVLHIIQPKSFSTRATMYGIEKEQIAMSEYITYQHSRGHPDISVSPSGFLVSTTHPFLGASPDGAMFDPSNILQPFGFLEIKHLYSARMITPTDACATSGFCCTADPITGQLKLKENHAYFSQFKVKWLLDNDLGVTLLFIHVQPKESVFRELSTIKVLGRSIAQTLEFL